MNSVDTAPPTFCVGESGVRSSGNSSSSCSKPPQSLVVVRVGKGGVVAHEVAEAGVLDLLAELTVAFLGLGSRRSWFGHGPYPANDPRQETTVTEPRYRPTPVVTVLDGVAAPRSCGARAARREGPVPGDRHRTQPLVATRRRPRAHARTTAPRRPRDRPAAPLPDRRLERRRRREGRRRALGARRRPRGDRRRTGRPGRTLDGRSRGVSRGGPSPRSGGSSRSPHGFPRGVRRRAGRPRSSMQPTGDATGSRAPPTPARTSSGRPRWPARRPSPTWATAVTTCWRASTPGTPSRRTGYAASSRPPPDSSSGPRMKPTCFIRRRSLLSRWNETVSFHFDHEQVTIR